MENIKLYPHQLKALEQCADKNRVAFYHDMGLGKTFTGAEKLVQLNELINLIVCQKSQVDYWLEHFEKYYEYQLFNLTTKNGYSGFLENMKKPKTAIIGVINYDLIWRRTDLLKLKDFTLLLDESSLIQNETSKRCKFILKLKPDNVILLSGTPVGGKYEKAWSQMKLLGWDISKKIYWNQFVRTRKLSWLGRSINLVVGYKNVERLKRKLRDYGAVFKKTEEVLNLPNQNFMNIIATKTF